MRRTPQTRQGARNSNLLLYGTNYVQYFFTEILKPVPQQLYYSTNMAKSKAPRKKYVPKPNDPVNIRFSEEDERNFQLTPHAELLKMRNGAGTVESWDTLEMRIKWGQAMARQHGSDEVKAALVEAFDGLASVHERYTRVEQYGLSGEESTAIGQGLSLTDELQLISTKRELRDSLNQTLAFLKKKPHVAGRLSCYVAG